MKCAIMQPTYLPWIGYFDLINSVDCFVFLDDVQFSKRSWQQRNRILLSGGEKFLTVPALTKGKRHQLINEVIIDHSRKWAEDHIRTMSAAYQKHPYGLEVIDYFVSIIQKKHVNLSKLNQELIKAMMSNLNIQTTTLCSSDLPVMGTKSEYLLNICEYIQADTYVSAKGSQEYIEEEGLFEKSSVDVVYQSYTPKEYKQKNSDVFVPFLSSIDIASNIGFSNMNVHFNQE